MKSGVVLLLTLTLTLYSVNAQLPFASCQNDAVHNTNATFRINLDAVLAKLISNATNPYGFDTATSLSSEANSTVHGIFYCRGDITSTVCRDCVSEARTYIRRNCPDSSEAVTWYDNCTLRYSNEPIISKLSFKPTYNWTNPSASPDQSRFDDVTRSALVELKAKIVNGTAGAAYGKRLFGTQMTKFSALQTITSLAQCSPDLSASDCDLCLTSSIAQLPSCCFGRQGARVLNPSCFIRYELYSFFADPPPEPDVQHPDPKDDLDGGISSRIIVAIVVPLLVVTALAGLATWYCLSSSLKIRWKASTRSGQSGDHVMDDDNSLQFSFDTIQAATEGFSLKNKIGEGGFGEVFMGLLSNGTQIAVKRLSECSKQGAHEFKNEVLLVAKLQHRNLVRLLGFCAEGPERILIYDFIPNKSLDHILFDPTKQVLLDWPQRYKIINGIARGMLYLHEDSPLKIIHRDLKASNILLDENLNPKISDFGTARIVGVDESQINTKRIVGTFGYMPPEYVRNGHFSAKSDVYSFGVLVLEIICGKKNVNCGLAESADLLSFVWKTWMNGNPLALLDPFAGDRFSRNEVLKCIHMALLCVQENVSHRPTMQTIVLMLNSSSMSIPRPRPPTHYCLSASKKDAE